MATVPATPIRPLKADNSQVFKDISKLFTLKRSSRWLIFTIFLLFNISMNMDNGTINCAAKEMGNYFFGGQNKLHNNETGNPVLGDLNSSHNKEMGFFKCVVFLGTTCGSIISAIIINKVNRKYFLMSSAILNGCCFDTASKKVLILSSSFFNIFFFCPWPTGLKSKNTIAFIPFGKSLLFNLSIASSIELLSTT